MHIVMHILQSIIHQRFNLLKQNYYSVWKKNCCFEPLHYCWSQNFSSFSCKPAINWRPAHVRVLGNNLASSLTKGPGRISKQDQGPGTNCTSSSQELHKVGILIPIQQMSKLSWLVCWESQDLSPGIPDTNYRHFSLDHAAWHGKAGWVLRRLE